MGFVFVQCLNGLAGASSLFLIASGLTLTFGVTRIVNFAHGSLFMLGAYIGWTVLSHLPSSLPWFVLGVTATCAGLAAIGAIIEVTLLRRLYRMPALLQLLATFGVMLIVQDSTLLIWGQDELSLARPHWMRGFVSIAGERFPVFDLALIALGPVVLGSLWLPLTRTRWGRLVRAATQDCDMLSALGVDQRPLFTGVFALGAALAGLAGALALAEGSADLLMDRPAVTNAFVVVVLGGLGSVAGAYVASVVIGVLQAFGLVVVPGATLVLVFVVMAAVLALRPNGLFGRRLEVPWRTPQANTFVRAHSRRQIVAALAGFAACACLPLVAGPDLLTIATEAAIAVLFAYSLHVMMGPGGMPSFGHAAWFGLGAYGAAVAATSLVTPMGMALLIGAALAGLVASVVGALIVRLSDVYLAMLTLAFAQIVWALGVQWMSLTGGDNGILDVSPPAWLSRPAALYWLTLGLCSILVLILQRALYAPFGYALRAARDSPARAAATGISIYRVRLMAFVIAATGAGVAGGLFAFAKQGVFPTYISIERSIDALVMVLLGGVATISGPIAGAIVYTGLYDALLRDVMMWRFALGVAIVALVLLFPRGLGGVRRRAE